MRKIRTILICLIALSGCTRKGPTGRHPESSPASMTIRCVMDRIRACIFWRSLPWLACRRANLIPEQRWRAALERSPRVDRSGNAGRLLQPGEIQFVLMPFARNEVVQIA